MSLRDFAKRRGFTLIETIMAMASVGVVGLSIFYTLYYGMLLYTKNTAMNVSHQEARLALLQLQTDIHQAVSPISLTDSNGNMVSGTSASAGVEFQVLLTSTEYCQVHGTVLPTASSVTVAMPSGYPSPYAGTRLIIPAFEAEADVTAVSVSGSLATCTLGASLAMSGTITGSTTNTPCFFTQRVYYYVSGPPNVNGVTPPLTMNYIGLGRTTTYSVGSEDLTCRAPFSIPSVSGSSGAPNYHAVTITGLTAEDPQATNLNSIFHFSTSSIMLSGQVPIYSTITTYQ
jgi:prepilin-type N-terminal cleavage/methylation domain-containing protein